MIIKNDIEKIAQQAIEFWSSICDMELKLFSYIEQVYIIYLLFLRLYYLFTFNLGGW